MGQYFCKECENLNFNNKERNFSFSANKPKKIIIYNIFNGENRDSSNSIINKKVIQNDTSFLTTNNINNQTNNEIFQMTNLNNINNDLNDKFSHNVTFDLEETIRVKSNFNKKEQIYFNENINDFNQNINDFNENVDDFNENINDFNENIKDSPLIVKTINHRNKNNINNLNCINNEKNIKLEEKNNVDFRKLYEENKQRAEEENHMLCHRSARSRKDASRIERGHPTRAG